MITQPELVEGEVDFSDWEFNCGEFDGAVRRAAQQAVAETLENDPPTIYMVSEDAPTLTIRIWLTCLAGEDSGPTYRFSLEELLEGEIGDHIGGGPESPDGTISAWAANLITELEEMTRRIKERHKHREIVNDTQQPTKLSTENVLHPPE